MRNPLSESLIARLLPNAKYTLSDLEEKFPSRFPSMEFKPNGPEFQLGQDKMVTRFAPSPTGFMHIGNLYSMMIDKKLAQQSGGVFFMRVEDTDTKREVQGATDLILESAKNFGLNFDEGPEQDGNYGPYYQSQRKEIYHSVAAELLRTGRAYPCFLSATDMEKIREQQKSSGMPTGIYGDFARDRNLTEDDIMAHLDAGEAPTIRLYSIGDKSQKIFCKDAVRGSIAFPQNDEDVVLIKSNDGLPTYHFAHLCDDHFMRTTHVVRGEEWLPSLPLHIQLFQMMEWAPPVYIHTSTLDTIDLETGKQRKLSKRKDAAANVATFIENGWPAEAVLEYMFNIVASGYEEAKMKGLVKNIWEYDIKLKKLPASGALFDMKKLEWWAREFIGSLPVDDLTARVVRWAKTYDEKNQQSAINNQQYLREILSIERDNPKRIRKDFITWKQTLDEVSYFFDDKFNKSAFANQQSAIANEFLSTFDINDDKDVWWNKIVEIANRLGIKNGDVAMALRVALTGRTNTPDLYSIMQVMGDRRVRKRLGGA